MHHTTPQVYHLLHPLPRQIRQPRSLIRSAPRPASPYTLPTIGIHSATSALQPMHRHLFPVLLLRLHPRCRQLSYLHLSVPKQHLLFSPLLSQPVPQQTMLWLLQKTVKGPSHGRMRQPLPRTKAKKGLHNNTAVMICHHLASKTLPTKPFCCHRMKTTRTHQQHRSTPD